MSIKRQAATGMAWNTIERFSTQGIRFILTILLGRILSPNDYGLLAMLIVFIALAQTVIDSGYSNALIQKKEKQEVDFSTAFYLNLSMSILIYLIFFFSAPWIATFYEQPQLVSITRVFALFLITNTFGAIQMTRLVISLDFKRLAIASLIATIVSGSVGLWMAFHGFGVWTLVYQSLIENVVLVATLWVYTRWIPKRMFSWQSFRELFSFGSNIMFSNLLHTIYTNMYSLVIGKLFNASILGYYNRAYTLGQFPVQNFGNVVAKVLYPILCKYQDDNERFNHIFTNYLRIASFLMFPLMIGLAVLAEPTISVLLTNKWLPAVPLFQIVCLALMWLPVMQMNVSVMDAKGNSRYHLRSEVVKKILAVAILLLSIPFGVTGICWGLILYSFADMTVAIAYSRKLTGVGYKKQALLLLPILCLSLIMGGIIWGSTYHITSMEWKLIFGIPIGLLSYLLLTYLCRFPEWDTIIALYKKHIIKKLQ
ncbi:MAG: lipopolysaccharide biosynthesis protein [Prevotellaceae bacterium]|jgi:O-antigen/teichoic acid export membrane protein|nr:lipopolysaccharide biosynthesis protein [Prevotellaceae bacterium]